LREGRTAKHVKSNHLYMFKFAREKQRYICMLHHGEYSVHVAPVVTMLTGAVKSAWADRTSSVATNDSCCNCGRGLDEILAFAVTPVVEVLILRRPVWR
jgi:hypothetical protein